MCGNFGLIMLGKETSDSAVPADEFEKTKKPQDQMDVSLHQTLHEVSKLHGLRVVGDANWTHNVSSNGKYNVIESTSSHAGTAPMLDPLFILEAQTAATEVRGGQAGGISSIEYKLSRAKAAGSSGYEAKFSGGGEAVPNMFRVRAVARKRYPLARDLAQKFINRFGGQPSSELAVTFVGHTRFATSSINVEPELHPHEWVPKRLERVWRMSPTGKFDEVELEYCLHLTHNGDFDAMDMYSTTIVNGEIGLWLERVLHTPNNTRGDSPKLAGMMDVMRVAGRWGPAARLGYVRLLKTVNDVCDGEQLTKEAPNSFPDWNYFQEWAEEVFEPNWSMHKNNIIKAYIPEANASKKRTTEYTIDPAGEKQLVDAILSKIDSQKERFAILKVWGKKEKLAFVSLTVRAFLRNDLYTALTEILSRSEGSFGIQAHCTMEVGVVVIASKGQPMSVSFSPDLPVCLYGSEAEAIAVPVDVEGGWLPERIDLDSKGEIMRLGRPRDLIEGKYNHFSKHETEETKEQDHLTKKSVTYEGPSRKNIAKIQKTKGFNQRSGLRLRGGIEILSYSLVTDCEAMGQELVDRSVTINSAPIPYDPRADLVAADLAMIPGILDAIDRAWSNTGAVEFIVAEEFCNFMIQCMKHRIDTKTDSTDLLIGGVEASLWVAEQFAADLRTLFPQLNIVTVSANKLLGLADDAPGKVFFPGTDAVLPRRIDKYTCALLISQSGQTFATLHATRKIASLVGDRMFLLTGCFNSKMEVAMKEDYQLRGKVYGKNRVFNNYSGYRPAEPTSAAIVATHHTLTRLMLHLVVATRKKYAGSRLIHKWEYAAATDLIRKLIRRKKARRLARMRAEGKDVSLEHFHELDETHIPWYEQGRHTILMNLSDGCIDDVHSMMATAMIPNIERIVGYNKFGDPLEKEDKETNLQLRDAGGKWGEHIREPWVVIVLVAVYLLISVGLGLPIFGTLGTIVAEIIKAGGADIGNGHLGWSPRDPYAMTHQGIGWTLVGIFLQFVDAWWYIYIGKNLTRFVRYLDNRPMHARMGARSCVIVDTPMVHQLTENFASKLYSQAYSFLWVNFHGASGLDHFVHRFTHRVVRGVLLAVGRPDGRLCCLAKSEAACLLAVKQAVFIENPAYTGLGSGPDVVSIGHNPFVPNFRLQTHIVLKSDNRRKFVDEYLYERLYNASKPFAGAILRQLASAYAEAMRGQRTWDDIPYGSQHINPNVEHSDMFCDFVLNTKEAGMLTRKQLEQGLNEGRAARSCDPAVRTAFNGRLDRSARHAEDYQQIVQQFYECRIASIERYVAFCVFFHAMAERSRTPWFCVPWDMARSQSNLRVATTASPVANEGGGHHISNEVKKVARDFFQALRGYSANF